MLSVIIDWVSFISSIGRMMSPSFVSCSFVASSHMMSVNDLVVVKDCDIDCCHDCHSYCCQNFTGCFIN